MIKHKQKNQRLHRFLIIKEILMILLVVFSLTLLVLEMVWIHNLTFVEKVASFELVVSAIFLGEFLFELYFARNRRKYWRHHWFYLFAAIPFNTLITDSLKAIRLLRLLKVLQIFAHTRYEYNTWLFDARHPRL